MAETFKVLIKWDELGLDSNGESKSVNETPIETEAKVDDKTKSPQTKATQNKSNDMMKKLQVTAAVYGFARQGAQLAVNFSATDYQVRGETLKAERMQTQFSNITNNVGLGLGVTASVLTGNPIAIGLTAYSLAQRAMNLAIEIRKHQAQISAERYRSQYYQNRLVRDISEVR